MLPTIAPTAVSDVMMLAVAYAPCGLTSSGWDDAGYVNVDEFIGWPQIQATQMQWPAENLAGPTITAVPVVPRIAGWVFAMPARRLGWRRWWGCDHRGDRGFARPFRSA